MTLLIKFSSQFQKVKKNNQKLTIAWNKFLCNVINKMILYNSGHFQKNFAPIAILNDVNN